MSEKIPILVGDLQPDDVVNFSNVSELARFEDMVAQAIEPRPCVGEYDTWLVRTKLADMVRPKGYNGLISDIKVVVMDNPYEMLINRGERGGSLSNLKHILEAREERKIEYKGYHLYADLQSTGRGVIGQIQTELYYLPSDWGKNPTRKSSNHLTHIRRIVSAPVIETDTKWETLLTARQIGFTALKAVQKK